jgi:hypothetical protein
MPGNINETAIPPIIYRGQGDKKYRWPRPNPKSTVLHQRAGLYLISVKFNIGKNIYLCSVKFNIGKSKFWIF